MASARTQEHVANIEMTARGRYVQGCITLHIRAVAAVAPLLQHGGDGRPPVQRSPVHRPPGPCRANGRSAQH
eukprot:m.135883 g.135883  ORF g.135883 m.135883 type:complete len:72 (-) comp9539_c0_seq7:1030-1245(-)